MSSAIGVNSNSRRNALADILLVAAASAVAYGAELALQEALPWGDEARGVLAVLVGAAFAVWVTLRRGRSTAELGFTRPKRWWLIPVWVVGILAAFIMAQIAAPLALSAFFEVPQPDFSRYDFIRGNLLSAIAMILVLPLTAAIPEEVLYRGFLIERLTCIVGKGKGGVLLAVLLQAIVFGSVHFEWGVGGILLASIMGAVWGFAFVLCGRNLWTVILAHSTAHVALVTQLYLS
jgi:membrane protease YdiL (CAAX protease family)